MVLVVVSFKRFRFQKKTYPQVNIKSYSIKQKQIHSRNCDSLAKASSYKRTQECLAVVSKEFQFQGHSMAGPCAEMQKSGNFGKRRRNIARDIQRKFSSMVADSVT